MTKLAIAFVLSFAATASAQTVYRIGPGEADGREIADLPTLMPGDTVEVMGGADYESVIFDAPGAEGNPIRIVGIPVAGARPVFRGGVNTIEFRANHYEASQLDITGGSFRCVFHHADAITIEDSVVHDCPAHGILGADEDSGDLTLLRVEVHHCGAGDREHQIYMATDETAYPGSVFRMEGCWVHDGNGGNGIKSRAERNEIYYNWIEGSYYHELELIGPDGQDEELAREDSDVVGNVLVKRGSNEGFAVVRFGGDGTGQTWGRYRFVANTVVVAPGDTSAVFRLFEGLESVEMHDNVFVARGGGGINLLREVEAVWLSNRLVAGSHNWVPEGSENVPPEWTDTIMGTSPGLVDVDGFMLAIASMSAPIVDQGAAPPPEFGSAPFPDPLPRPLRSPIHGPDTIDRPEVGAIDLGAYEFGTAPPPFDGGMSSFDAGMTSGVDAGMTSGVDGGVTTMEGGCGCRAAPSRSSMTWILAALLPLVLRRRR
jgi:hypothetical protein